MSENINNNPIWWQILDLFPDNSEGEISPADIRAFVKAVQKHKEDQIHFYEKLVDIFLNRNTIFKSDIIIIKNENELDPEYQNNGIYISLVDNPLSNNDLYLVTKQLRKVDDTPDNEKPVSEPVRDSLDLKYDKTGGNIVGDILIKDRFSIHYDESTKKVYFILTDVQGNQKNYLIFEDDGRLSGFSNAPSSDYDLTNKKYVDDSITNIVDNKENFLGNPSTNNQFLTSDPFGNRTWKDITVEWGNISGDITNQGDLNTILNSKWDGTEDLALSEDKGIIFDNNGISENLLTYNVQYNQNNNPYAQLILGSLRGTITTRGRFDNNILLDEDISISGHSSQSIADSKSLIRRTSLLSNTGTPSTYNRDLVIGDAGILSAIYSSSDEFDPVVRKGTWQNTTDYKIYTTEHFAISDFADRLHIHEITDINNLQQELDDKANIIHTHEITDINNLQQELDSKSDNGHIHSISEIVDLQQELDNKSSLNHRHLIDSIDGLRDELDTKWDGTFDMNLPELISITDDLGQNILSYVKTQDETPDFFDYKNKYHIGNENALLEINSTIVKPLVLKNDLSIKAWNSDYTNQVNLISRADGTVFDNEVLVGDNSVKTAIRAGSDIYDPVVRKGTYGNTTDYMIYTSEHFDYRDIASLNHTHEIDEVIGLQSELNSKFSIYGGTISGPTTFDDLAIFKGIGRSISFNNIPENGIVYIDNGLGDDIIEIKKLTGSSNYDFTFHGTINAIDGNQPTNLTTKEYVDNNLQHKLDTFGGIITGDLEVQGDFSTGGFNASEEITTTKDIRLGTTDPNYSVLHFNYGGNDKGVIFYDNTSSSFKIGDSIATASEFYTTGNLNIGDYFNKREDTVLNHFVLMDSNDISNPNKLRVQSNANYHDVEYNSMTLYNEGKIFSITNNVYNSEISFGDNTNSTKITIVENEPPSVYHLPTKDNHLVIRQYVDDTFLSLFGGKITGDLDLTGNLTLGKDTNGNSILRFNYGEPYNPKIYFDNSTSEFKIDLTSDEGYILYHNGNLNVNDYLAITGGTLTGDLTLNNSDYVNPSTFKVIRTLNEYSELKSSSINFYNNVEDFNIFLDDINTGVKFTLNGNNIITFKDSSAPECIYSPTTTSSLTNKSYVDSNFLSLNGGTLLGHLNLTETLKVGKEGSNSVIRFNYDNTIGDSTNGAFYLDNNTNEFKLDILGNEGYTIWHTGNFEPKDYLKKDEDNLLDGILEIELSDPTKTAYFAVKDGGDYSFLSKDTLKFQKNNAFTITLQDTEEVTFDLGTNQPLKLIEGKAPKTDSDPMESEDLTRKDYVDNNFLSLNGGSLLQSLTIGDGINDNNHLILESSDSFDKNASFIITRPSGTYRTEIFANTDDSAVNIVLYSSDGSAEVNRTSFLDNGNVRVIDTTVPNSPWDLTTKDYVDSEVAQKPDTTWVQTELDSKLDKSGGTISGDIDVSNDIYGNIIYGRSEIRSKGIISIGLNGNDNSAIQFNYENGLNGVLWYDNSESSAANRFKIDVTNGGNEGYTLYHSGNYPPAMKVFQVSTDLGTSLSRSEIDDVVSQQGPNALDFSKSEEFYIIDSNEHTYFVRWFPQINKYAYEKLSVR